MIQIGCNPTKVNEMFISRFLIRPKVSAFKCHFCREVERFVLSIVSLIAMSLFLSAQAPVLDNSIRIAGNTTDRKPLAAMDFQIRVDIYSDESRPPVATLQTYFTNRMYIEFDDQNGRCTVVDPMKGRVTLLDTKRKSLVHLEMSTIEMQLDRALQLMNEEQLGMFQADAEIRQEPEGYFSIGNAKMRYSYLPITTHGEIATSYGDFTNWVCRVKALYPPKMPPQMRLMLNELLMDQSQIPSVVKRQIVHGGKLEELVARLNVTESLSDLDRSRIANIYQWLQQYTVVTDTDFFK